MGQPKTERRQQLHAAARRYTIERKAVRLAKKVDDGSIGLVEAILAMPERK